MTLPSNMLETGMFVHHRDRKSNTLWNLCFFSFHDFATLLSNHATFWAPLGAESMRLLDFNGHEVCAQQASPSWINVLFMVMAKCQINNDNLRIFRYYLTFYIYQTPPKNAKEPPRTDHRKSRELNCRRGTCRNESTAAAVAAFGALQTSPRSWRYLPPARLAMV